MFLIDVFKHLPHWLAKALHLIHDLVPEETLAKGVELVKAAADKFEEHELRRAWVLEELMKVGLGENVARLVIELAVSLVKKETNQAIDAGAAAGQ